MLSVVLGGTESQTGINGKSMDNYEFLEQFLGKKDPVDQQLSKSTVKQVYRNENSIQ